MPLVPLLIPSNAHKPFQFKQLPAAFTSEPIVKKHSHSSLLIAPPTLEPNLDNVEKLEFDNGRAFGVSSASTFGGESADKIRTEITKELIDFSPFTKQAHSISSSFFATTLSPLTIHVSL